MNKTTKKLTYDQIKAQLDDARKQNDRMAVLFANMSEGIIVTNEYGRIEKVNRQAENILGFTEKELIDKPFLETIRAVNEDGSFIDPLDRSITKAFTSGEATIEKAYYLNKIGLKIPVYLRVSPFLIDGIPSGAINMFTDLTDEYTDQKTQSEFISNVSHQLRTPLSTIGTYAQMLSKGYGGKLQGAQLTFVETIEHASYRMSDIIHSLRNFTRVDAGNISVNVRPVNTDTLCKEVMESIINLADNKGVFIKYTNNEPVIIDTDPVLLREILSNLISNGIQYTPAGGNVELAVHIKGQRLTFTVSDDGFGIPDEAKDHIFSKYYRADNIIKQNSSGTGIGLYLVRQLTERLEGDIWFKSTVNEGTTFNFCLPLSGSLKKSGTFTLETSLNIGTKV